MAELTPMRHQYLRIKEQCPDCILFFRLGDFYEMFDEDARVASRELDLMLTTRDRTKENPDERTPMCGVPYHSAEAYIGRLIAKGYRVAICEQMEDPALAKGLVDRDIIRIVTPGTLTEASMLDEGKPNYIASVFRDASVCAVCFADVSTGEISVTSFPSSEMQKPENELVRFSPVEAILSKGAYDDAELSRFLSDRIGCAVREENERFDFMQSAMHVCEQFGENAMEKYGLDSDPAAVCAVGALLSYIKDVQKADISHISTLDHYSEGRYMELDIQTVHNLELISTLRSGDKKGSLLWVLDKTKTPMGSRLIRSWMTRPLLNPAPILRRQAAVGELVGETVMRGELIASLRGVGDIERLTSRIVCGTANCRDLTALAASLRVLPELTALLAPAGSSMLRELAGMDTLSEICDAITQEICDEPPFSVREGGMIRDGYSSEVDHLRSLLNNSSGALADIEARERERTGKKLKVGYNRVFGYYIEIPRSASADVPDDYIRKQTLVNCERFITQELKELETQLLTAKDDLTALEFSMFTELREKVGAQSKRLEETAAAVASLDTLCSLAFVAANNNYCMPDVDLSGIIEITDGRHPVVEAMQTDTLFVPNDVSLGTSDSLCAIITGPNMAGKSTYMRQTALIVLMAQMGSFVPAKNAHIGIVDRVFTRIGASDDLSAGKSTFMVEMTEVAEILKNATKNSLIILDEIGRGTSTYDGMAIARAVLERCADRKKLGAKTLFATHYHELCELENVYPGVRNFSISAKKRGRDLIFLRKIVPGAADDSYGIEVADLAGVPEDVIRRAKGFLTTYESKSVSSAPAVSVRAGDGQLTLGDIAGNEITDALRAASPDTMTPLEALNFIYTLKKKLD